MSFAGLSVPQKTSWLKGIDVVLCLAAVALAGCSGGSGTSPTAASARVEDENNLDSVRETLRKQNDHAACRNAVQQLNTYFSRHPDERPPALKDADREFLVKEVRLAPDELRELDSTSYTLLDAHYMDQCYLMRDAARGMGHEGLPAADRAKAAFFWVTRQVRLVEGKGDLVPPHFVLRRGWGNGRERAMIFLALLEQLGIDGCLVGLPGDAGPRFWLAGAAIDKDIWLFDTRMGLPLPGPEGKGIATLAQVRAQPALLEPLTISRDYPYDVKPNQAGKAEVYLACALSSLAPRMRHLQAVIGSNDPIKLSVDAPALRERLRAAAQGAPVSVWNDAADVNSPVRLLRCFLPAMEGGIDRDKPEAPDKMPRLFEYHTKLVPMDALPDPIKELPPQLGVGQEARSLFQRFVLGLSLAPPGSPRDLILRGRAEEATTALIVMQDEMYKLQTESRRQGNLEQSVVQWCNAAKDAYATLIDVETRHLRSATAQTEAELATARERVRVLEEKRQPVLSLIVIVASKLRGADLTYLLSLSKQERAERLQTRLDTAGGKVSPAETRAAQEAWQSTADWWKTFLQGYGSTEAAAAARRHRARALAEMGQSAEAAKLLDDLSGKVPDLDGTARLYLAQQLRATK